MARQALKQGGTAGKAGLWLWVVGIIIILIILSKETMIILGLGFLPTAVAWLCDRSKEKFATFCVGGLNTCGVFPYLLKLWVDDYSWSTAMNIVSDVFALAVMYAAAGFGWALFLSIPPVVAAFLNVIAQQRVAYLRTVQKAITDEWGHSVTDDQQQSAQSGISETAPAAPTTGG